MVATVGEVGAGEAVAVASPDGAGDATTSLELWRRGRAGGAVR